MDPTDLEGPPTHLFARRRPGPRRAPAPELPTTREEMDRLGWDSLDVIIVTGDAYVDHASFGAAIVGRLLEAQGFTVGIIPQPDWRSADDFRSLGPPNLFFGVTAGNMDSMVNRYTADHKIRSNDAYTANGEAGRRPDRALLVYAQRCREAFKGIPVIVGGIEASLRRVAQFDYWSEKIRRSALMDSKADLLVHGNGERQIVEIAHRLADGEGVKDLIDIRGTAFPRSTIPESFTIVDATNIDAPEPGGRTKIDGVVSDRARTAIRLPSYEAVKDDPVLYAHASRIVHRETNPGNARVLVQAHGNRDVWLTPPAIPLTTPEMDGVFELPFSRRPHSRYEGRPIPAYEMIRFSITITRGCFGGCSFCSITEHEGRIIQNRSEESVLREMKEVRDTVPGFTGVISDLGGPTANMYGLSCKSPRIEAACRRASCLFPKVCPNLLTDHGRLIDLYKRARDVTGVKKVLVASGVRIDLAALSPEYVEELATHHVGGYLKVAPEHTEEGPLHLMRKPGSHTYDRFKELFDRASKKAGLKQYLIPYFIAAHPGTTDEDMLNLALWLKRGNLRVDQVQTFLPSPMASATAMYHSGKDTLKKVEREGGDIVVPKGLKIRRLHKAFLRYHDKANWPVLRKALARMGRADLIGRGKQHLVPPGGGRDGAR